MTPQEVQKIIEQTVPGATAFVLDPMKDGQHLQALVISAAFENLSLVKQHQLVMQALKDAFESVHALGLKTFTPQRWNEVKEQYGF